MLLSVFTLQSYAKDEIRMPAEKLVENNTCKLTDISRYSHNRDDDTHYMRLLHKKRKEVWEKCIKSKFLMTSSSTLIEKPSRELVTSKSIRSKGKMIVLAETPIEPIPAVEPNPIYIGGGLVWGALRDCSTADCAYEDVTYGGMLRAGYEWNQYFGLEARVVKTFWDEGPLGGTPLAHKGLYLKPQYPLGERSNIYALLGYGCTENLGNGNRLNYFDDGYGMSGGIGFEYDLSDMENDRDEDGYYDREFDGHADQGTEWSLFVDYQRLLIGSNIPDMDVVSVGFRYDF